MASRRSNGEGTFYRRKDGRYEGAVYVLTVAGGRRRVHVYGKTLREAQEKVTAAKMQSQEGLPVPDRAWRLSEYLDYWLTSGVHIKRRPLTYRRAESITRLYLQPGLGNRVLHHLSVRVVQEFLDRLYADGQSACQVHQIRKVLSAALTYAMRQELVVRNVGRLVELPTYRPHEAAHWSVDEAKQFLEAAKSDPLYPAFVLLILYGLRRGEVLGLRWCDIDYELGVLRIRQQVQRIDGELRQVPLKTRTSDRDEPLLAKAIDVLRVQQAKQAALRTTYGERWPGIGTDKELVFTTRSGLPVESHNLARSFLRISERCGLRRITIHGLRHTNATTQKNLQVHARDIQAILGHGDVRTTGLCQHVELQSKKNALEKVEKEFFEYTTVADRGSCRTKLSSMTDSFVDITMSISGGASQARTGDTRLFRIGESSIEHRLQSVRATIEVRRRAWLAGVVVVQIVVHAELLLRAVERPGHSVPGR